MGSTVVVGLDGSAGSLEALAWAARLGSRHDVQIQPVLAWDYPALALLPFPVGLPVPPQEAMQADAEVRADGLVDGAGHLGEADIARPLVRRGSAGRVLCEASTSAELLVIGSRGLGSVKGLLLGSVSAHCAAAAPCPVALVPLGPDGGKALTELVVVGVDGSPTSDAAVEWADTWAPTAARLLVVHVWDVPISLDNAAFVFDADAIQEAAVKVVDRAAGLVQHHEVETLTVRGDARLEMERLGHDADFLVLGARGHSRVERILMGSVATHAVHHLVCPTVIVRSPE